jgi:hypothetical protein
MEGVGEGTEGLSFQVVKAGSIHLRLVGSRETELTSQTGGERVEKQGGANGMNVFDELVYGGREVPWEGEQPCPS